MEKVKDKIKDIIKNEYILLILMMLGVEIFYLVDIFQTIPLHTTSDELGAMIAPAYLAGRDWSGVVSHSGYYGFGFFAFFFWVFKITSNPIIIYRIIIIGCSIQRIAQIPIAYYIGKKYLSISNSTICVLMATLMPFLHTTRVISVTNEYSIELIVWLDILLVLKMAEHCNKKSKGRVYTFLWVVLLVYSQTIHTRMQVLAIANIIVVLFISIKSKKRGIFIGVSLFLVIFIGGVKELIKIYQENIWGSGENLRNASVKISSSFDIFSEKTWKVWGHMLLGMFDTMVLVFGGIFLLAVITFLFYFIDKVKKLILKQEIIEITYYDVVFMITILCMGATILAFLISSWGEGILRGWDSGGTSKEFFYSFKGLTYIRYWEPYVAPFCFVSLARIVIGMLSKGKIIAATVSGYAILQILFINFVVPLIEKNGNSLGPLRGISMYKMNETITKNHYMTAILIATSFFIVWIILFVRNKYKFSWIVFISMLMFQYQYTVYQYDLPIQEKVSLMINASYEKICELKEEGYSFDNIYIYDAREKVDNNWTMYSISQFYLNEYTIIKGMPDELQENDLIISNKKMEERKGMARYQLDENEIWYVNEENVLNLEGER